MPVRTLRRRRSREWRQGAGGPGFTNESLAERRHSPRRIESKFNKASENPFRLHGFSLIGRGRRDVTRGAFGRAPPAHRG
ncbi:hypothetical protein EVAR_75595_1 [Eumeta japonica]|uniref:Uncharacterized protein n=1 Tax=Eumeta variegata TaxID=151549 RepID=A0A4C1TZW0_EUMVA|nr:hypothetical protein EVAR_75595_1 [Eumeta japonica]